MAKKDPGRLQALGHAFWQGLTFGYGDELISAVKAALAFNRRALSKDMREAEDYMLKLLERGEKRKAAIVARAMLRNMMQAGERTFKKSQIINRGYERYYRLNYPYTVAFGELTGAVVSPISKLGAGVLGKFAPASAPMLQRMAVSGLLGGVEAALYAGGKQIGGIEDRINAALKAAPMGAAVGAALPPAQEAIAGLAGYMRRRKLAPKPQVEGVSERTADWLAKRLAASGDPEEALQLRQRYGELSTLMDVHPQARLTAEQIVQSDAPARSIIIRKLRERYNSSTPRIQQAMDEAFGPMQDVFQRIDDMVAATRRRAAPLYEAAYRQVLPVTDDLLDAISRPSGKAALRNALRRAADKGLPTDDLQLLLQWVGKGGKNIQPPTQIRVSSLDMLKRALDDMIEPAKRQGKRELAATLKSLRDYVMSVADEVPEYAQARQTAKSYLDIENAFELGQKMLNRRAETQPEVFARRVAAMSPEEREALKQGGRVAVANWMDWLKQHSAAGRRMFDAPAKRANLRTVLGDKADELLRKLEAEKAFADTYNEVLGNSATARRLDSMLAEHMPQTLTGSIRQAVVDFLDRLNMMSSREFKRELAQLLADSGKNRDAVLKAVAGYIEAMQAGDKAARVTRQRLLKILRTEFAAPIIGDQTSRK